MDKHEAMMLYCLAGLVVKDTGETVENFLSDASKWADKVAVPKSSKAPKKQQEMPEKWIADIEEIYKAYPAKCPRRMQSTGKCAKDKERIAGLLKNGKTKEQILKAINQAVSEGAYLKNFSTFLNNLPEVEEEIVIDQAIDWV